MAGLIERIRNRSFRELGARALQQLAIFGEMTSPRRRREMSDRELLDELLPSPAEGHAQPGKDVGGHRRDSASPAIEQIRSRLQSRPAIRSLEHADAIAAMIAARFPEERLSIIRRADRAKRGKYEIFGGTEIAFDGEIDWRLDPLSGKRTPLAHWSRIDYLNAAVAGDKKVTWEINRHSHFITLGQAYLLTDDETYVRGFVQQASSWMDQNPPGCGINWSSSLELAFRVVAWTWALSLFARAVSVSGTFLGRFLKYLIAQGRHIETHLSTCFSPNTHLTGEALGLFCLGTWFPEFKRARQWRQKGLEILLQQMPRQIRDDGVYFEQSSFYHRYTVDFYLSLFQLARETGIALPASVEERLAAMVDYLMWISRPDGTPTLVGDDDGGKLLSLSARSPYDFRDSIAWAAALLQQGRWKYAAGEHNPELLWLLGPGGLERFDRLVAHKPVRNDRAFVSSGQFVARSGWEPSSAYLFFRCGPRGALTGAHDHADQLSFEIFANGTAWLVDPGTYTYTLDRSVRNQFRSSDSHNTLTVDGASHSVPLGPFSWRSRASGASGGLISNHRFTCVSGCHDGYRHLGVGVEHRRMVMMIKCDYPNYRGSAAYCLIIDEIDAESEHEYELFYHFGPGIAVAGDSDCFTGADRHGNLLHIGQFATVPFRTGASFGQVSSRYSHKQDANVGWIQAKGSGRQRFCSVIFPVSADHHQRPLMSRFAPGPDLCLSVEYDEIQDLFIFGETSATANQLRVQSSARVTWLRFADRRPKAAAIVEGTSLALEGLFDMSLSREPGYLLADIEPRGLSIYTDKPVPPELSVESELLDLKINGCSYTANNSAACRLMAG